MLFSKHKDATIASSFIVAPFFSSVASPHDVKLITFWASPFGLRAEFALTAKKVPYEKLLEVDHINQKSKLLLQSNPIRKKIPVLIHNGTPVPESLILIQYIDEVWPSPDGKDLLPKDPYRRAQARFWADYVDKQLYNFLNKVLQSPEKKDQREGVELTLECIANLEEALGTVTEEPPFFGGANLGFVDVVLGSLVPWMAAHEAIGNFKYNFEEKLPRLEAWMKAFLETPCAACFPDPEKTFASVHSCCQNS